MKILLTGSTGFLGQNIRYLLEKFGHEVICPRSQDFLKGWDMLKESSISEVFQSVIPEVIVHAAWGVDQANYRESVTNSEWRDATVKLYEAAARYKVKHFVALGTFSENERDLISGDEHDNSLYAESKRQARSIIFKLEPHIEVPVTWLRIQYPYGYWDRPGRLVSLITRKSILGEALTLNSPKLTLDFIHSLDVANAVLKVVENQIFGILEVKTGEKYSLQYVQDKVGDLLLNESGLKNQINSVVELFEDQRREMIWRPLVTLDLGLSAFINDLQNKEECH